jgi:Tfp pilus assembly protein PilN
MIYFHSSLGIDFKGDYLNIVHLVRTFKGISLNDYASLEPFYDPESSEEDRLKILFEDLRRFVSDRKITPHSVILGLPRKLMMSRFINIPVVPKDEVGKVIEYELDRLFPYTQEELYYDYKVLEEDSEAGLKILVLAITKKFMDSLMEILKETGLQLSAVQSAGISIFNLYGFNKKGVNGTDCIFMNFENTFMEITASKKGAIFFTKSCDLNLDNNTGTGIVSESIQKELEHIKDKMESENPALFPSEVILCGKLDPYRDILMDISSKAEFQFLELDPFSRIKNVLPEKLDSKSTIAVSLALQGLANLKYNLNLLPSVLRVKIKSFNPIIMVVLLSILVVLVSGILIKLSVRERSALKDIKAKLESITKEANEVKGLRKKVNEYAGYIQAFESIKNSDISKLIILSELSRIIPDTEEDLVWLNRLEINGDELQINGYAQASEGLLKIFEKSPFFSNARFEGTTTKDRDGKERFTLIAKISADAKNQSLDQFQEYNEALTDPAKFMELEKKRAAEKEKKQAEEQQPSAKKTPDSKKQGKKEDSKSTKRHTNIGDLLKKPVTGY